MRRCITALQNAAILRRLVSAHRSGTTYKSGEASLYFGLRRFFAALFGFAGPESGAHAAMHHRLVSGCCSRQGARMPGHLKKPGNFPVRDACQARLSG
jgi:hypothetical protein